MNLSPSRLGATALLVVTALTLTTACAGRRREAFLHDKARTHVYRKPLAEVWPQALALIKEEGYSLRAGKEGYVAETEWLMQGAPSSLGTTQARYFLRGVERGPGQCAVEIWKQVTVQSRGADNTTGRPTEMTEQTFDNSSNNANRDEEMEWKLIQRVDAESANALRAEAEKIQ